MNQHSEDNEDYEMLDLEDAPSFVEAKENISMKSISTKSRGRPKLPILWTRVIDIEIPVVDLVETFSIDEDIENLANMKAPKPTKGKKEWEPLFYTNYFTEENQVSDMEAYRLPEKQLKKLATSTVKYRADLVRKAEDQGNLGQEEMIDGMHHVAKLSKKVRNRGETKQEVVALPRASEF